MVPLLAPAGFVALLYFGWPLFSAHFNFRQAELEPNQMAFICIFILKFALKQPTIQLYGFLYSHTNAEKEIKGSAQNAGVKLSPLLRKTSVGYGEKTKESKNAQANTQ